MKKRGFTLAELLIVLGITGVVAALILPAINGLMPDKTKVMYLRVYDELSKNIKQLASDSSLYPVCLESGSESIGCSDHPLLNTTKPINKRFDDSDYEGNKKLCKLLAFTMKVITTTAVMTVIHSHHPALLLILMLINHLQRRIVWNGGLFPRQTQQAAVRHLIKQIFM